MQLKFAHDKSEPGARSLAVIQLVMFGEHRDMKAAPLLKGIGALCVIEGWMNKRIYWNILEENVVLLAKNMNLERRNIQP